MIFQVSAQYLKFTWLNTLSILIYFILSVFIFGIQRNDEPFIYAVVLGTACLLFVLVTTWKIHRLKKQSLEITPDSILVHAANGETKRFAFTETNRFIQRASSLVVRTQKGSSFSIVGLGSDEVFSHLPVDKIERSYTSRKSSIALIAGLGLVLLLVSFPMGNEQITELVFSVLKVALGILFLLSPREIGAKRWLVLVLAWFFILTGLFSSLFWIIKILIANGTIVLPPHS